jgi:plasmid stability protein
MPGLLIKDFPERLHRKLKSVAANNRRSMTQQALVLLEEALNRKAGVEEFPPPARGKIRLTKDFLDRAKRLGRP